MLHPKKWSIIAKKIYGRTQHAVKNRFFFLIGMELELSRQKTSEILKEKNIHGYIEKVLEILIRKNFIEMKENSNSSIIDSFSANDKEEDDISEISFENAINYLFGKKEFD